VNWRSTWQLVASDLVFLSKSPKWHYQLATIFLDLRFQILLFYRLARYFRTRRGCGIIVLFLLYLQQVLSGCHINPGAEIGEECHFGHPTGVVIGQAVRIGNRVTIYQHVTLGGHGKPGCEVDYPIIEDDAVIYASAIIIGSVRVGRGAIVGAQSIVLEDVPAYTIVAGAPARVIRNLSTSGTEVIAGK
jgi:serine O-acetyltransferase